MEGSSAIAYAIWMFSAYMLGAVPFGFIIGKARGIDVRKAGSGNIGATNVFRCVGRKWGLLALALDTAKGLVPVATAKAWGCGAHLPLAVGVAAVAGHMLTPFMKFKGGKGVATAFGMLIGLAPLPAAAAFALFAAIFVKWHYISLASCTAATFLGIAIWFPWLGVAGAADIPQCLLVTAMAASVIWKHRSNIKRLANGTESKIYLGGKGE